jgi:hypothetical protein
VPPLAGTGLLVASIDSLGAASRNANRFRPRLPNCRRTPHRHHIPPAPGQGRDGVSDGGMGGPLERHLGSQLAPQVRLKAVIARNIKRVLGDSMTTQSAAGMALRCTGGTGPIKNLPMTRHPETEEITIRNIIRG